MPLPPPTYAAALREAIADVTRGVGPAALASATEALIGRYRSVAPAGPPILDSADKVAAYAAYRMPATHAALTRVLQTVAATGVEPVSHLDLGGGTGAAAWASAEVFPSLRQITVLDQAVEALRLGERLVGSAPVEVLREASFTRAAAGAWPHEAADLVTVSYVLSELDVPQQERLVADALALGTVVVIVEPGTPDGYERILHARTAIRDLGWQLLGPCPHAGACPLAPGDWCHFSARVNRSAEHRRIKGGELSYEDEKFSWVAGARPGTVGTRRTSGRILRHPLKRKGFVEFQVCRPDGTAGREVISKKQGQRYRDARDAEWGDVLP
ncbi:small ribosomal subunit Rsm22 [Humibacillus xanthopallidus]|uniref:Small ribosomal subunit Rsm22 n=1 Tax=Humibacillus xanthopallidus TaxID=412689 RepID=A0A543PM05_9MICO|nr:small ribosomal subunit Rsm22 family protein [Humibacillus xanthopallidus]TQN45111.1 small ribosomal subunit Rsm22 [Humibacillus xanthopallidus]